MKIGSPKAFLSHAGEWFAALLECHPYHIQWNPPLTHLCGQIV